MKAIDDVVVVDCVTEMVEHVFVDDEALVAVVNCRGMMDIVVEAIVVVAAAAVDFANNCAFVVEYFGNSKDLDFVLELANSNFVVGVVVAIVVAEAIVVEVVVAEAFVVVEFDVD